MTKITTGVAATVLALSGIVVAAGVASAAEQPVTARISVPVLSSVTLTGTVVNVEGKYVTIAIDGTARKVVVKWDELTTVVGDIKKDVKVKVVTSTLEAILDLVKAQAISVLN